MHSAALGDVQRIALIVGVNHGLEEDRPLRYAARDAKEMAALLRQSGLFDKDRIYLLEDASLDRIKGAMDEVAGRVKELEKSGSQTLVVFFYSGHGGADALHIQGKKFSRAEITSKFNSLGGDIRIMILDACESGDFLRQKGGAYLDEGKIQIEESLQSRGSIILSASSRGEKAQESEEYRGAVFSHHFMNGLKGMADYNADNAVTLMEAFDYARETTRMEKVGGRASAQNPSYDFDLVGESDPVLVRLNGGGNRVHLAGLPWGPLEIYETRTFSLAYQTWMTGRDTVTYMLPAGRYILSYPGKNASMVKTLDLTWDREATLSAADFQKRPKSILAEKGGRDLVWNPHGLQVGFLDAGLSDVIRVPLLQIGYAHQSFDWIQTFDLGFGYRTFKSNSLENDLRLFRAAFSLDALFLRWRFGMVSVGGAAAWNLAWQSVSDLRFSSGPVETEGGGASLRNDYLANVFQLSLPVRHVLTFPGRVSLSLGAAGTAGFLKEHSTASRAWTFGIDPLIGVGYRF